MKQRLIGAAVLVALAVIFLPMLLDRPAPGPGADAVQLDIPAPPGRDFETRELPLELPPAPGAAAGTAPATAAAAVASGEDSAATVVEPTPPAAQDAAGDAATPATSEPERPETATPGQAPATAAPAVPTADSTGRYAVNLGSFGNAANARALQERLEGAGLAVYSESIEIDGKPATRLRAGPYAGRADAEAARLAAQRLQSGLAATVVTLDADAPAAADARSGFAVQVGAFRDRDDALKLRDRLRGGGVTAFVDEVQTDEGRLHRVRAGPETERSRAERLRETLRERFQLEGLVVSHP